jgi:hypothetical protein
LLQSYVRRQRGHVRIGEEINYDRPIRGEGFVPGGPDLSWPFDADTF